VLAILIEESSVTTRCGVRCNHHPTMGGLRQEKNKDFAGMPTALGKRVAGSGKWLEKQAKKDGVVCNARQSGVLRMLLTAAAPPIGGHARSEGGP
jgi:hypothetical protein